MDFKLYIIQFLNDLRYQKLRAFLTLFGVVWGTTAIVTLIAVSEAQERNMLRDLQAIGENLVLMWPGRTSIPYKGFGRGRPVNFLPEDVQKLRDNIDGLGMISAELSIRNASSLSYKKVEDTVTITGVEPDWSVLRNVQADLPGRFFSSKDMSSNRRVVFIGSDIKETFFGKEDALGKTVYIDKIPFQVIGVMAPRYEQSRRREKASEKIYIPLSTLLMLKNENKVDSIMYRPEDILDGDYIISRVNQTFAQLKNYDPEDPNCLRVWNTGDHGEWIANFSFGIQVFFGIVGVFTVIVAGIGVANIMNVIVEERTREIGIKMSLGMKRKIILIQFMFETLLLIVLGGLIGLGLSFLICYILTQSNVDSIGHTYVTFKSAFIAISILAVVAFAAGFFPAKRAANLNPVEALRWQ